MHFATLIFRPPITLGFVIAILSFDKKWPIYIG